MYTMYIFVELNSLNHVQVQCTCHDITEILLRLVLNSVLVVLLNAGLHVPVSVMSILSVPITTYFFTLW